MSISYISTRGQSAQLGFQDVMMTGLARDGGLYLPARIPDAREQLQRWRSLSYLELAFEIMRPFVDIPDDDFRIIIQKSYSTFTHPEVAPLISLGPDLHLLELFHGPTLAFKDIALQLLGNLFEYTLLSRERALNVLAATSGDTGSAAIYGVKGKKGIRIFVLYPEGGISPMQERQMASVADANVFCIALKGDFDDCQAIVKEIFNDLGFRDQHRLGAVNSINWARILAQIVYYFYGAFRLMDREEFDKLQFSVPTGNFGDIFAGYIAARMGLPIDLLILASNENDILPRFFNTGLYRKGALRKTITPSMDIQVASNFERYLYYLVEEDPSELRRLMAAFAREGQFALDNFSSLPNHVRFAARSSNTEATLDEIKECYESCGYLLDPHTAAGVSAAKHFLSEREPVICLATAHPAKFGGVVKAALGQEMARHPALDRLLDLPLRRTVLPASASAVRDFIQTHLENTEQISRG